MGKVWPLTCTYTYLIMPKRKNSTLVTKNESAMVKVWFKYTNHTTTS